MSNLAYLSTPSAMSLPTQANAAGRARVSGSWQVRRSEESLFGLSWLVAIAGTFLLIGMVGMLKFRGFEPITFSGRAGLGAVDNLSTDTSMADLPATEESLNENPTDVPVDETLEVPEPVEIPLEMQDLPELTDALVTEDVFTVPAAPKIEVAMKPVDPATPKLKPKPKAVAAKPRSSRATSTVTTVGGTEGSGGGNGGGGRIGSGSGKGNKRPQPPYPSGARSRKVEGKLMFSFKVSPSGKVEYAAVISSNCTNGGFTAAEQSQIASWICRNWLIPGQIGSVNQSVKFEFKK